MVYEAIVKKKLKKHVIIHNSEDAYNLVKKFADSRQEKCILITLDICRFVIGVHIVHIGTTDFTPASIKDIFYKAIMDNANSIIVCHNHLGDSFTPSPKDMKFSDKLYKAGSIMDIDVGFQLIITQYGYTTISPSFEAIMKGEITIK
jgi:DNA repair protein RadC